MTDADAWRVGPREWPAWGRRLAGAWPRDRGLVVYLDGPLGAGKTSLVRGFLRAWDPALEVTSPSFVLREDYAPAGVRVVHVDLYRLKDPREVEDLALRDLAPETSLFVEWPGHGRGHLPPADLLFRLVPADGGRLLAAGAGSPRGETVLASLRADPWCRKRRRSAPPRERDLPDAGTRGGFNCSL